MTQPPNPTNTSKPGEAEQLLDARVIWVDLVRMLLSLVPLAVTTVVAGGAVDGSVLWPAAIIGVAGVAAAISDVLRWAKTRYRITDELVEVRTGLVVRTHRSIRRDRIRSVDTTAKLRHRLAGLRIVEIRAGDRTAGGKSASLRLDAVSASTAARLQAELPAGTRAAAAKPAPEQAAAEPAEQVPAAEAVLATFRWRWLPYNAFTIWAFLTAAGLGWGAYWFGNSVGVDLAEFVVGAFDRADLPTGWTIVLAVLAAGTVGVVGVGAAFVAEQWAFRLVRADTPNGTVLRTSHGLFRTRRIDRDEGRLRGVELRRRLLWRWTSATETSVVSTGLTGSSWSTGGATVLPMAPLADAMRVATAVLRDDRPLRAPLRAHPAAALRRRLGWAAMICGVLTGALWLLGRVTALPANLWLAGVGLSPVAAGLAVLAYRSLGHAVVGRHLVTSSGLNRSTVVLSRDAVIGVTFRQSVLQRRLGLVTLRTTTAAGRGSYPTPDLHVADGVALADTTVPGLLTPYLRPNPVGGPADVARENVPSR
ncbi:PH domain-containing protein [Actinophytocola sediminis]